MHTPLCAFCRLQIDGINLVFVCVHLYRLVFCVCMRGRVFVVNVSFNENAILLTNHQIRLFSLHAFSLFY